MYTKQQLDTMDGISKAFGLSNDIIKGGEGSKGGKVIGHTKSGKPIYSHKTDLDSTSAGGIHGNNYKGWSKEDHLDAYIAHSIGKKDSMDKMKEAQTEKDQSKFNENHKNMMAHGFNTDAHYFHAKKLGAKDVRVEAQERMDKNEK